ncbi:MAG: zf-HC2 domain-containing protein [Bryobacteraceae bacterium]
MDHETSVRTHATERYLLNELSDSEREEFEEHYFTCPECAGDVRTASEFAANARAVFSEEKTARPAVVEPMALPGFFGSRWAAPVSVGLNLALLAFAGYHVFGVLPQMRREIARAKAPEYVQEVVLVGVARGPGQEKEISPATRLALSFSLTRDFDELAYEIKDAAGGVRVSDVAAVPVRDTAAQSLLVVPMSGLVSGEYAAVLYGVKDGGRTLVGQRKFRIK